jgi:hypothetical protein
MLAKSFKSCWGGLEMSDRSATRAFRAALLAILLGLSGWPALAQQSPVGPSAGQPASPRPPSTTPEAPVLGAGAFAPQESVFHDKLIDYVKDNKTALPSWEISESRDANIVKDTKVQAIFMVIKFHLKNGNLKGISESDQKGLLASLSDTKVKFIYTGKQTTLHPAPAGQSTSANRILINQEAFLRPNQEDNKLYNDPYDIAQHVLHETAHDWQNKIWWTWALPQAVLENHPWFAKWFDPISWPVDIVALGTSTQIERFPRKVENALPKDGFDQRTIEEIAKILTEQQSPEPPKSQGSCIMDEYSRLQLRQMCRALAKPWPPACDCL